MMMTMKPLLVMLALAAVGAAAERPAPSQHSYLVTVLAESGEPVTDLTAADFSVREGGTPLTVVSAEHSRFPLVVSVLIDTTQPPAGMNSPARELRSALAGFVAAVRANEPGARIALVEVGGGAVTTAPFGAAPEDLDAAIQRIMPAHPSDAMLLEAYGEAARGMSDVSTPRRAIVSIDFNSSEALTEGTMKRVTGDLQTSGATVWAISIRLPRAGGSRREPALNLITDVSGGQRLVASAASGLPTLFKRVADSLSSQYIVTFERTGSDLPKSLEMETKSGQKVRVSLMRR
jgi:hypothetical protein